MLKVVVLIVLWASSLSAACPPIYTREQWGARAPTEIVEMGLPVSNVVIHHTVMGEGNCSNILDCIGVMQEIQDFHMDDNGWADIGYSFLIGEEGTIFIGRGWNRVGAHAPGYNDKSIGISLIGNFMDHLPLDVQLKSVHDLINCGIESGFITSEYLLYGHRDVKDTDCPGNQLYEEISNWPEKATPAPN